MKKNQAAGGSPEQKTEKSSAPAAGNKASKPTQTPAQKFAKKPASQRRGQAQFAGLAGEFLKPHLRKKGFAEPQLSLHWRRVLPHWAGYTFPLKLSPTGVLTVAVVSDSVSQQMAMEKLQILAAVNQFLGHAAVGDVRFKTQPQAVPPAAPKKNISFTEEELEKAREKCKNVPDVELAESLAKLSAILNKENKK